MFWTEASEGSIYRTSGLTSSELGGVPEFQGDQFGCETWGKSDCGRKCGHGHGSSCSK